MAIETKKLTEVDVLDAATKQTNVLVVENGTTMQLPASSLGGSGGSNGATIHVDAGITEEIDPSDVNTKYKVGDLLYTTDHGRLYVLFEIIEVEGEYFHYPQWKKIYPADSSGSFAEVGRENPDDSDAPTADQRIYFRGEWSESLLSGYGPAMVTYNGALYFTAGNFYEGGNPEENPEGWLKLSTTGSLDR